MEIREALDFDIPDILKVLKVSLGESSSQKSEAVWRYKHIDNPFGRSLVLLAIIDEKIVGVRAFMRWRWQLGEELFSAFRAVDTATDPKYQGRGIFKKLTLRALEIVKEKGDSFVFNTPNSQSKPGYLKMGWAKVDKVELKLIPVFPFFKGKEVQKKNNSTEGTLENVLLTSKANQIRSNQLFTPKNVEFLNWRYKENPLQDYEIFSGEDYYIALYVKRHKYFNELRISECILGDNFNYIQLKSEIKNFARLNKVLFISVSHDTRLFSYGINGKFGPILTFKNINLEKEVSSGLMKIDKWNYTLGDLELF